VGLTDTLRSAERLVQAAAAWGQSVVHRLTPAERSTLAGRGVRALQQEIEFLELLQSGKGLEDHLEPGYFKALERIAKTPGAMATHVPGSPVQNSVLLW